MASRRGVTQWHLAQPDMDDLRCMSFTSIREGEIVVAGCQREMYRINVDKGAILSTLTQDPAVAYTMMRRASQWICAASHDGSIHLLDPKTLAVAHSWKAYAGSVNDMDARGDYLLTCGWAQQQYHGLGLKEAGCRKALWIWTLGLSRPAQLHLSRSEYAIREGVF